MEILIVDDHPLFLEGISPLLEKLVSNVELFTAQTSQVALELMDSHQNLELILLDLNLPDTNGLSLLQSSRERLPKTPVVMLTASTRHSDMQSALSEGAKGYICKSSTNPVVLNALSLVLAGGIYIPPEMVQGIHTDSFEQYAKAKPVNRTNKSIYLTPRQIEVLTLLIDGKGRRTNKDIANALDCSEATVKVHITALLKAMDVSNRIELQIVAKELDVLRKDQRNSEIID